MSLPYDIVIDPSGVWYGPSGTSPKSRDWLRWDHDVAGFFSVICRQEFDLNVITWRVREGLV